MESIYYVMTFLCHRTCRHCYEDRFRPYPGVSGSAVVAESIANHARIIDHLPARMTYLDMNDCDPVTAAPREKIGRIILAGGEILLPAVREPVLYSGLDRLRRKYGNDIQLVVQTTGDVLTSKLVDELLRHGVDHISVSGIDPFHDGMDTPAAQMQSVERLTRLFESCGMQRQGVGEATSHRPGTRYFSFFGATPDSWIGALWPRGRAQANELSTATLRDNFCNRWSGALNFLQYRHNGSEVSVEPNGNVYPCCIKTKAPIGNLLDEPLENILQRRIGDPVYEALSMGHPERMGIAHGWSVEKFFDACTQTLPSGKRYQNLCIGCDRFHEDVLIPLRRRSGGGG